MAGILSFLADQNPELVLRLFFQDIFKQATEDRLTSANELPYFEGDFWPNVLEESIKELEQEEEERKKEENTAASEMPEVQTLHTPTVKLSFNLQHNSFITPVNLYHFFQKQMCISVYQAIKLTVCEIWT